MRRLCTDTECARQFTHQPVDRRSFLGGRGEIEPAQPRRFLIPAFTKHRVDQCFQRAIQPLHLGGKAEHFGAAFQGHIFGQAGDEAGFKTGLQCAGFAFDKGAIDPRIGGQRRPPDLFAFAGRQAAEKRLEPRYQIGLGHHQIDRQLNFQPFTQFRQPFANLAPVVAHFAVTGQQFLDRQSQDHAIECPLSPVLFQHVQKPEPLGGIDIGLALLLHIAPGGIDQHGILGKEPVAVAGTADAFQIIGQINRKVQPRLPQRRGLAGTGGTDDDVPRHVTQKLLVAHLRPLHLGQHLRELGIDLGHIGFTGLWRFLALRGRQFGDEHLVLSGGAQLRQQQRKQPKDGDDGYHDQPHNLVVQRCGITHPDQRAKQPDQRTQQRQPDKGPEPSRKQKAEYRLDRFHQSFFSILISTRRFSARPGLVPLSPTGSVSARPSDTTSSAGTPAAISRSAMVLARASDRP